MRIRWKLVLPILGLVIFGLGTASSVYTDRVLPHNPHRYFWWSSIRLDPDPLNKHPHAFATHKEGRGNYTGWELRDVWVEPGWLAECFMVLALPAFVAGMVIVHGLGRLGVNEVWSFMISMPFLILAWYCFIGWLLDHWKSKRTQST